MADVIRKVSYFAMDVADKPGEAARVLKALSQAGVNLLAFSGFPRGRLLCRGLLCCRLLCCCLLNCHFLHHLSVPVARGS